MRFNEHQHPVSAERRINHKRPAGLVQTDTRAGIAVNVLSYSNPPSCAPFALLPLRKLHRYYGRSDFCSPSSSGLWSMNTGSFREQTSLFHAADLPNHSVSNHLMHRCRRFYTLPLSATTFPCGSRLRHRLAGSPVSPGRIEFVILRTGRSPPAAPHHASLRRSCIRLQAGERMPGEDFHLSNRLRLQAH